MNDKDGLTQVAKSSLLNFGFLEKKQVESMTVLLVLANGFFMTVSLDGISCYIIMIFSSMSLVCLPSLDNLRVQWG